MPHASATEVNALRRLAEAARAFVSGRADRPALADALRLWEATRAELSQLAFVVPTGRRRRGGKGGYALRPTSPTPDSGQPTDNASVPAERSEARTTWITPYYEAFRDAYAEPPTPIAVRRMARAFKELEVGAPRDECVRRFARYCAATPARFYSVEHFASTFAAWQFEGGARGQGDPAPGESVDAYLGRLARQ